MQNQKVSYNEVYKKWYWFGDYESRTIPQKAGMSWDKEDKIWWTSDISIAEKLIDYMNESELKNLKELLHKKTIEDGRNLGEIV